MRVAVAVAVVEAQPARRAVAPGSAACRVAVLGLRLPAAASARPIGAGILPAMREARTAR